MHINTGISTTEKSVFLRVGAGRGKGSLDINLITNKMCCCLKTNDLKKSTPIATKATYPLPLFARSKATVVEKIFK